MTRLLLALVALAGLTGCLPNLNALAAPRFRYQSEGSGLVRLDPPGVGEAQARFRFNFEVANPNDFGLRLAGFEGTFFLNGRAVPGRLSGSASVPAEGSSQLALEVRVPLTAGSPLLSEFSALLAGRPTRVRVEAAPVLAFGQLEQALPPARLFAAALEQPLVLAAPRLTLDARASGPREVSAERAVYRVVLLAENAGSLGYVLTAPGLELELAGERLASAGEVRLALPAFTQRRLTVDFELAPGALAALARGAVTGVRASALGASVRGGLRLELAGIAALEVAPGVLTQGVLR